MGQRAVVRLGMGKVPANREASALLVWLAFCESLPLETTVSLAVQRSAIARGERGVFPTLVAKVAPAQS